MDSIVIFLKISQRNSFIHIDGQPVDRISSSKALGVVIDERLCCSAYTDYICKKVSSAIGGLRQIRDFIPLNIAVTVYNGWIQQWLDYCDVVWNNLTITSAERLRQLQNRAARIITRKVYDIRSSHIRDILKRDTLQIRRFRHKAIMMYNIQNNKALVSLRSLFTEKENSDYNLRSNNNFQLALGKPRTEYLKRTFVYSGAKIWNNLPCKVKQCRSLGTFKRELSSVRPPDSHF